MSQFIRVGNHLVNTKIIRTIELSECKKQVIITVDAPVAINEVTTVEETGQCLESAFQKLAKQLTGENA